MGLIHVFFLFFEASAGLFFSGAAAPGYASRSQTLFYFATQKEPIRTLNVERLPFSPLWGLTVVGRGVVLNGILLGLSAYALR